MICARPGCGEAESRLNGYCSVYCEDRHELEVERDRLREALRRRVEADDELEAGGCDCVFCVDDRRLLGPGSEGE